MFLSKRQREIDKEITGAENDPAADGESASVIKVKIDAQEQLFSAYSYSGDKLNPEFCEYVFDKAKRTPIGEELTLMIHTDTDIDATETDRTVKAHYRAEYIAAKKELKRISVISLIMTLLGVIALATMVLLNHFLDNFYISTITEIAAWVFIWEAVDYFFLQRPLIKAKCLVIQRIYSAKTEICKTA